MAAIYGYLQYKARDWHITSWRTASVHFIPDVLQTAVISDAHQIVKIFHFLSYFSLCNQLTHSEPYLIRSKDPPQPPTEHLSPSIKKSCLKWGLFNPGLTAAHPEPKLQQQHHRWHRPWQPRYQLQGGQTQGQVSHHECTCRKDGFKRLPSSQ